MAYRIQKGIPLPAARTLPSRKGVSKYPLAKMEPGDHFFVPLRKGCCPKRLAATLSQATNKAHKEFGFKFTVRTFPNNTGVGVWRLSDISGEG